MNKIWENSNIMIKKFAFCKQQILLLLVIEADRKCTITELNITKTNVYQISSKLQNNDKSLFLSNFAFFKQNRLSWKKNENSSGHTQCITHLDNLFIQSRTVSRLIIEMLSNIAEAKNCGNFSITNAGLRHNPFCCSQPCQLYLSAKAVLHRSCHL